MSLSKLSSIETSLSMSKYSCDRCGKDFGQKSHLDSHNKRKKPCDNLVEKVEQAVASKMAYMGYIVVLTVAMVLLAYSLAASGTAMGLFAAVFGLTAFLQRVRLSRPTPGVYLRVHFRMATEKWSCNQLC